jgi:hypothetical protein
MSTIAVNPINQENALSGSLRKNSIQSAPNKPTNEHIVIITEGIFVLEKQITRCGKVSTVLGSALPKKGMLLILRR